MKRVLCMLCAVAICLGMAGCGKVKNPLSFYVNGKETLTLGMSKEEIESILTPNDAANKSNKVDETKSSHEKIYEDMIMAFYTENIAHSFYIGGEKDEYSDCFGNHIGMNYNKAKSNINKKFITENEEGLAVYFNKEGELLTEEKISDAYSCVQYTKDYEDKIESIFISADI